MGKPADDRDQKRIKAARLNLRATAAETSTDDIRKGNDQGKKLKAALGEFFRAEVEPKGSDGPR